MIKIVENKVCDNCGKKNTELVQFNKKVFRFFNCNTYVCQSCISKTFRSFNKDK